MGLENRIVIIGASGMLGQALQKEFPEASSFNGRSETGARGIDLTKPLSLNEKLGGFGQGDWIINAAAYTDVDGAEAGQGSRLSFCSNVDGPYNLAALSKINGFGMVHFSTDYVFDGKRGGYKEDDPTNPINQYGQHKLLGEKPILESKGIVLRTSNLYGLGGKNFVDSIRAAIKTRGSIEVVGDLYGCPTYVKYLASVVRRVLNISPSLRGKIIHAVNSGSCSRAELARETIKILGSNCQVKEITVDEYNLRYRQGKTTAKRPRDSSLISVSDSLTRAINPISWQESLKEYLKGN